MKYESWDDYKWFLLGCALTSSKVFWSNTGDTNKELIPTVSADGSVGSVSYVASTTGGDS